MERTRTASPPCHHPHIDKLPQCYLAPDGVPRDLSGIDEVRTPSSSKPPNQVRRPDHIQRRQHRKAGARTEPDMDETQTPSWSEPTLAALVKEFQAYQVQRRKHMEAFRIWVCGAILGILWLHRARRWHMGPPQQK